MNEKKQQKEYDDGNGIFYGWLKETNLFRQKKNENLFEKFFLDLNEIYFIFITKFKENVLPKIIYRGKRNIIMDENLLIG